MDENLSKLLGTNSILVYDLETKTVGSRPDGTKDEFRIFGCYSYLTGTYHILTKPRLIKQMIDKHKFLVGFNNKEYDNNILFRMPVVADSDARTYEEKFDKTLYQGMYISKNGKCGFSNKITIDLMEIFKKRAGSMKIKKGMLGDLLMKFTLSYIAKTIELGSYKDDNFDYGLLAEPVEQWSKEKLKTIVDYTKQDLLVTKEMYEWLEEYFGAFKDFVSQENIDNKSYLTCSTAVFAYKCLCKELGMEEEYGESGLNADFGGGFVALPTVLEEHGEILLYDWSSLYPSLFMMGNLFGDKCSCCTKEEKWHGDGFFKVEGYYCRKKMAALGEVLKKFYLMRKEMKKIKDPREYAIKIFINSSYGAVSNSSFKNIYNPVAGADCTRLGRQVIRYSRKRFKEEGYELLFTDTDSVGIKLVDGKTQEDANKVAEEITKELLSHFPFPQDFFEFKIDAEITDMFFVKDDRKHTKEEFIVDGELDPDDAIMIDKGEFYLKKNYLYITKDGEVTFKNLNIKKKSVSALSRTLFREILIPEIKLKKSMRFSRDFIDEKIRLLLDRDISLAAIRYSVKTPEEYKVEHQIQAQIARRYGSGIKFLVPNYFYGVGKAKKYCLLEEFIEKNFSIKDLDLSGVYKELKYFIIKDKNDLKHKKRNNRKKIEYSDKNLSEWFK